MQREINSFNSMPSNFVGIDEKSFFGKILAHFDFYFLNNCDINDPIYRSKKKLLLDKSIQFASFSFFNENTQPNQQYLTICFENNCFILFIPPKSAPNSYSVLKFMIKELFKCLFNKKIQMISINDEDYQNFQELLKEYFITNNNQVHLIDNIRFSKKYNKMICNCVKILVQKNKFSFKNYPLLQIAYNSLLTFIIGRFYYKSKLFQSSDFHDLTPGEIVFNDNDFIDFFPIAKNIYLTYQINTCQLLVRKLSNSDNNFLEREESIYKLIQDSKQFIKCIGTTKYDNGMNKSLILEYMSKGNLFDYIKNLINKEQNNKQKKEKYEIKRIIIITEIINQLKILQSKEVIHRDMKPDNIFIDHDTKFYIGDFGNSIQITKSHKMTAIAGSEAYSAPETNEFGIYSYKTDVYSFGCIIYFIYTGRTFLDDIQNLEYIQNIKNNISNEDVREIFVQCIEHNPELRPNAVDILTKMLEILNKHGISIDLSTHDLIFDRINESNNNYFLGLCYYGLNTFDINQAIHYFTIASNLGNPFAQCILGRIYYEGKYVSRDMNQSFYYLQLAASQNNAEAFYILGIIIYKLFPQEINKLIYYFNQASNLKHSKAQGILGMIYYEHPYIKHDINKAIYYLNLSANQNNVDALSFLGKVYLKNYLIPRDINKSLLYYKLAAEQNDGISLYNLGKIYYEGEYIEKNVEKAIYYWNLGIKQNDINSFYGLATIYFKGSSVPRDIAKSIYYLELAANQGYPEAQADLGFVYSLRGTYFDSYKAIYYMKLAARKNISSAQYNLGLVYLKGSIVKQDIDESIRYLTLASNIGSSSAQYLLGKIYYEGKYVKQDINKSLYFLKLAFKQNNPDALYLLGLIHYIYIYLQKNIYSIYSGSFNFENVYSLKSINNIDWTVYYWELADKKGNPMAQFGLGVLYYDGQYVRRDVKKAIDYYKKASNLRLAMAKNNLGIIYKNGINVNENIANAIDLFNEGMKLNDVYSFYNYARILYFDKSLQNLERSIILLNQAANQDLLLAYFFLYFIYSRGDERVRNIEYAETYKQMIRSIYPHPTVDMTLNNDFRYDPFDFFKTVDLYYLLPDPDYDNAFVHFLLNGEYLFNFHNNNVEEKSKLLVEINSKFYEGFEICID